MWATRGLFSAVLVGIIWGVWHWPLYSSVMIQGSSHGAFWLCFLFFTIALSILFTWMYNATKGSLAVVTVFHSSLNATTISFLGPAMSARGMKPFVSVTAAVWIAALSLVITVGRDLGRRPETTFRLDPIRAD